MSESTPQIEEEEEVMQRPVSIQDKDDLTDYQLFVLINSGYSGKAESRDKDKLGLVSKPGGNGVTFSSRTTVGAEGKFGAVLIKAIESGDTLYYSDDFLGKLSPSQKKSFLEKEDKRIKVIIKKENDIETNTTYIGTDNEELNNKINNLQTNIKNKSRDPQNSGYVRYFGITAGSLSKIPKPEGTLDSVAGELLIQKGEDPISRSDVIKILKEKKFKESEANIEKVLSYIDKQSSSIIPEEYKKLYLEKLKKDRISFGDLARGITQKQAEEEFLSSLPENERKIIEQSKPPYLKDIKRERFNVILNNLGIEKSSNVFLTYLLTETSKIEGKVSVEQFDKIVKEYIDQTPLTPEEQITADKLRKVAEGNDKSQPPPPIQPSSEQGDTKVGKAESEYPQFPEGDIKKYGESLSGKDLDVFKEFVGYLRDHWNKVEPPEKDKKLSEQEILRVLKDEFIKANKDSGRIIDPFVITIPQVPVTAESGTLNGVPFATQGVKTQRYHYTSILLFFGSTDYPQWDTELMKNIMSISTPNERMRLMDLIIKEHGPEIFVTEKKGSSSEECNEIVQLYFCLKRNMARGTRTPSALISIQDLTRFQNKLSGVQGGPGGPQDQQEGQGVKEPELTKEELDALAVEGILPPDEQTTGVRDLGGDKGLSEGPGQVSGQQVRVTDNAKITRESDKYSNMDPHKPQTIKSEIRYMKPKSKARNYRIMSMNHVVND